MSSRSGHSKRGRGAGVYPISVRASRVSYSKVVSYKVREGLKRE
jgi:hypothetical protein